MLQELETLVCEKGYRYSDITILADKKDTLSNIAQYLSEQSIHGDHIPLVSSESFRLDNSKVVMFLVSLLKYLIAPGDRLTVSSVLQRWSELCPQDRTFYLQMLSGEDVDLEAMLARKGVDLNPDVLLSMTLLDCCEELIRLFHLDGMENNYVAAFLNYIVKYGKNHRQDIAEFISWFDERMESKTDSLFASATSDTNAIRLMTVHKAKGLEAPVVIYLLPKKSSRKKNIWVDVPQSEADNLALPISWITVNSKCSSSFDMQFEQESRMELAQQITSMILSLRKKEQIVVKQPLQRIAIPAIDQEQQQRIEAMKQLILDEVNVKELEFVEASGMLVKKVKCNFRTMGKKFGKLMKAVNNAVLAHTSTESRYFTLCFATWRKRSHRIAIVSYEQDIMLADGNIAPNHHTA